MGSGLHPPEEDVNEKVAKTFAGLQTNFQRCSPKELVAGLDKSFSECVINEELKKKIINL
jgi:hypothetical protein